MENPHDLIAATEQLLTEAEQNISRMPALVQIGDKALVAIAKRRKQLEYQLMLEQVKVLDLLGKLAEAVGLNTIEVSGRGKIFSMTPQSYCGSNFLVCQQLFGKGTPTKWPTVRVLSEGCRFDKVSTTIIDAIKRKLERDQGILSANEALFKDIGEQVLQITVSVPAS